MGSETNQATGGGGGIGGACAGAAGAGLGRTCCWWSLVV